MRPTLARSAPACFYHRPGTLVKPNPSQSDSFKCRSCRLINIVPVFSVVAELKTSPVRSHARLCDMCLCAGETAPLSTLYSIVLPSLKFLVRVPLGTRAEPLFGRCFSPLFSPPPPQMFTLHTRYMLLDKHRL